MPDRRNRFSVVGSSSSSFLLLAALILPSTTPNEMARQFFVGGNFKMNPISREQKKALVKTLNDATVDQAVG